MDDALLSYYNRELAYLRRSGKEFAERHPRIAGRLRLDGEAIEDPHVARLVESFAFLTARIREKLDDGYPELTDALMGILYPDFQAPIPSLAIGRIALVPERLEARRVAAGTLVSTDASPLGTCYYRTCFDTDVLPVHIADVRFTPRPFRAPPPADERTSHRAVLRIRLRCEPGTTLGALSPRRMRFYLNGQPELAFTLYEFLLRHATVVAVAAHAEDPDATFVPAASLRPGGLSNSEAALPADGRSSAGTRLVTEYFAFPEKFLFVELDGLDSVWSGHGDRADIYVYFDRSHPALVHGVDPDALLLGCTPLVNLYEQTIESVPAAEIAYEHRLSVDATQARCADIHTLHRLFARDSTGRRIDLYPLYGDRDGRRTEPQPLYWQTRREPSRWYGGRASRGSDVYLSFVDADSRISTPDSDWLIGGDALCTNRDVPDTLPFGPGQPHMEFPEGGAGLHVSCVTAPTAGIQPNLDGASRWQLVTQLTLQHFSGAQGLARLKQALALHDVRQTPSTRSVVEGLVRCDARRTTARITRQGRAAICQGTAIDVELEEVHFSGTGVYLFSSILNEFLAQYCTINTFIQLTVHLKNRPGSEIRWPPVSGRQALL